jgi:hypothetical protein
LPDDPESTILKRLKKPKPEEEEAPANPQRSGLDSPGGTTLPPAIPARSPAR